MDSVSKQDALQYNGDKRKSGGEERLKVSTKEKFAKSFDYIFACCGSCIGLGNVWKFPFLCYKNGGGAFLIPYFTAVLIIGIPVFLMESALGQFMSGGGMKAWNICPLFQGIGLATSLIVFLQACTYNVIMAWAFYYLFSSFTATLPWSHCQNDWNTPSCRQNLRNDTAESSKNRTVYTVSNKLIPIPNTTVTMMPSSSSIYQTDPVAEFWERKVLAMSEGIENIGGVKWDLCLCLLLAWILVYFVIWKGLKVSGKVLYFTVIIPYILMIILMVRGITLDGAMDGIGYYLKPNVKQLGNIRVWADAGFQVTYSYGLGNGVPTVFGSYNKFRHKSYRDIIVFVVMNTFTSLLSGFIIFSVLGFMSKQQGVNIADVAESGPGLAFIAYPEAVARLPAAPVWSVVFFLTLLFLGIDSQFGHVEAYITSTSDVFPQWLRKRHGRELFVGAACIVSFLLSLPMITRGGVYMFLLIDFYVLNHSLLFVILMEIIVVSYIYGVNRFLDNIEMMYGRRLSFFKIYWTVLSPVSVLALLIFGIITYTELTYEGKASTYHYPGHWRVIGWCLTCSSIACFPGIAAYRLLNAKGTIAERFKFTMKPVLKKHQLTPKEDFNTIR